MNDVVSTSTHRQEPDDPPDPHVRPARRREDDRAVDLAARLPAVRFTPDEWLAAFGLDRYGEAARARLEKTLWTHTLDLLRLGQSVIIDYDLWARVERDEKREVRFPYAQKSARRDQCGQLFPLAAPRGQRRLRHRHPECLRRPIRRV
jgi:hypothetical protein